MARVIRTSSFVAVSLLTCWLAGCGGDSSKEAQSPSNTTEPTTGTTTQTTEGPSAPGSPGATSTQTSVPSQGMGTGMAPSTGGTPTTTATTTGTAGAGTSEAANLTDEQIVAITQAANQSEIEEGKLASTKAKNANVKKYAQMMVKHHTDANTKGQKLAQKLKLTPAESNMTADMKSDSQKNMTTLQAKTGADFDKAYIEHQIDEHQRVLNAIDTKLLPSAKNAELKTMLTDLRPTIQQHLDEAKKLQTSLEGK